MKRIKNAGDGIENDAVKTEEDEKKNKDDAKKPPEPPKDYIHVRARRGQATDSHSLAERVSILEFNISFHHHLRVSVSSS